MLWRDYIVFLVVALERQELDAFRFWVLAQQDPKKFKWNMLRKDARHVGDKIVALASHLGARPMKSDVWNYAQHKGQQVYYQIQTEDGRTVYVDDKGKPIEKPKGMFFIPTKNPKAKEKEWGVWL